MARTRAPKLKSSTAQAFDELRADYNASKNSRFRRRRSGVGGEGTTADYHYRSDADYLRMMELARDFERNDVVVGQGVTRLVDNVVQDGFNLDPQTGDTATDELLKTRWREWSTNADHCDLAGEMTFHSMERMVLRRVVVDGDILALGTLDGPLQLVEAHRLRSPSRTKRNVVHGVELDQFRKRLRYWLTRDDLEFASRTLKLDEFTQHDARDGDGKRIVFHIFNPQRVSQTRGVTAFAPIADVTGIHDDLQFAQLVKAQVAACFAIFRQRDVGSSAGPPAAKGAQETETQADGSTRLIEGIAPGMEITGEEGETLEGFSPNVPNQEFFAHAQLLLTFIAINLNLPVAVLLLDPSKTNFSGWRGAIDQARTGFRVIQHWMVDRFHTPVYQWKVRQWLEDDEDLAKAHAMAQIDAFAHRWNPPAWRYIQPEIEGKADLLRVRNALTSQRRLHAERGVDWQDLAREIVEDNAFAIRLAKAAADKLNAEYPNDKVHWREIICLPTPDGVQTQIATDDPDQENKPLDSGATSRLIGVY